MCRLNVLHGAKESWDKQQLYLNYAQLMLVLASWEALTSKCEEVDCYTLDLCVTPKSGTALEEGRQGVANRE